MPTGPTRVAEGNGQHIIDQARKTVSANLGESESPEIHTEVVCSSVVPTLIDASKGAWMIVTGSRGQGALGRLLLGSVSTALIHHAHCPVAVIHSDRSAPPASNTPVLVGIDGSLASEAATALAFEEASRRGVDLVALYAWSDVGVFPMLGMDGRDSECKGQEILAERLAGWQEQYPDVRLERSLFCDQPSRWLLKESERAQLVVVGSHGRGGISGNASGVGQLRGGSIGNGASDRGPRQLITTGPPASSYGVRVDRARRIRMTADRSMRPYRVAMLERGSSCWHFV